MRAPPVQSKSSAHLCCQFSAIECVYQWRKKN